MNEEMFEAMTEEVPGYKVAPKPQGASRLEDIFVGIVRWVVYSVFMLVMLVPFLTGWRLATGCMLLGHLSAQLNKLINKETGK